jgi:hypothetical protein
VFGCDTDEDEKTWNSVFHIILIVIYTSLLDRIQCDLNQLGETPMQESNLCIGTTLKIQTIDLHSFIGQIYAYDKRTNMIAFLIPHGKNYNVKLFKASFIKDIEYISAKNTQLPELKHVPLSILGARFRKEMEKAERVEQATGVGVSKEAQALFDSIAKMYSSY